MHVRVTKRAWVKKGCCLLCSVCMCIKYNFNFPYLQGRVKLRTSEPSLSCALGMKEPVIGSKTSCEGK